MARNDWADGWRLLSVRQPWAWAIVAGQKPVENRSWSTDYRGPLVICAGKKLDDDFDAACATVRALGVELPEDLERGGVVGICRLTNVAPSKSPWAIDGQRHWHLEEAERWKCIPWQGAQGLVRLSPEECQELCLRAVVV